MPAEGVGAGGVAEVPSVPIGVRAAGGLHLDAGVDGMDGADGADGADGDGGAAEAAGVQHEADGDVTVAVGGAGGAGGGAAGGKAGGTAGSEVGAGGASDGSALLRLGVGFAWYTDPVTVAGWCGCTACREGCSAAGCGEGCTEGCREGCQDCCKTGFRIVLSRGCGAWPKKTSSDLMSQMPETSHI